MDIEVKEKIEDKDIIKFLRNYLTGMDDDIKIERYGIKKIIIEEINMIINTNTMSEDELRKKLSENIGRITSIDEFREIKNYGICSNENIENN